MDSITATANPVVHTTATGIEAAPLVAVLIEEGICAEITPNLAEGYAGMLTSKPARTPRDTC